MASLPNAVHSKEVRTLDSIRATASKAVRSGLSQSTVPPDRPTQSTTVHDDLLVRLGSIVESALLAAHGSQKAAAIEIGCDQSQMKRQLRIGTFDARQMAAAGDVFLANLGAELTEAFGSARKTKRQLALEQLPLLIQLTLDALTDPKE